MNSPGSAIRQEMAPGDPPASPSLRYPQSVRRDLLTALGPKRQRTEGNHLSPTLAVARARRMKGTARTLILLWIPIWYVIGQLSLFVWMDDNWELERTISERQKLKLLHERLAEWPDRPLVLMLGSSRMDRAFQSGLLSGQPAPDGRAMLAFNLGVPTVGGMHEMMYLSDLLAEGVRPRLLLVEFVSTHLIRSIRGLQSEEHFTVPAWIGFHQLFFMQRYFTNRKRAWSEWLESRLAPWYGYRWWIHEHLQGLHSCPERQFDQSRRPIDPFGWRLLRDLPNTPGAHAVRWAIAYNMYGQTLKNFKLGAKPAQALIDLFDCCRRENIPVALVMPPVSPAFRELFCPEGQAEIDNFVAHLKNRFNLDIIDATDWLADEDFDDGHHVMISGASKFTARLIPEVHKLLAQTEPTHQAQTEP
jgi:hypothetical protein